MAYDPSLVCSGGRLDQSSSATSAVVNINDAPSVANYGNRTAGLNEALSINMGMLFSDLDGDALTFAASGLPTGLSINSTSGLITGTTPNATGMHHITVTGTVPRVRGGRSKNVAYVIRHEKQSTFPFWGVDLHQDSIASSFSANRTERSQVLKSTENQCRA